MVCSIVVQSWRMSAGSSRLSEGCFQSGIVLRIASWMTPVPGGRDERARRTAEDPTAPSEVRATEALDSTGVVAAESFWLIDAAAKYPQVTPSSSEVEARRFAP